jgi:hypothetical protein
MGFWNNIKKEAKEAAKDPRAERIMDREKEKHDALMVVRQAESAEVRPKRLLIFEDRVELHDPGFFSHQTGSRAGLENRLNNYASHLHPSRTHDPPRRRPPPQEVAEAAPGSTGLISLKAHGTLGSHAP